MSTRRHAAVVLPSDRGLQPPSRSRLAVALITTILAIPATVHAAGDERLAAQQQGGIRVGGSSTVFPILREAIQAFRAEGNRVGISLRETGTTDGFRHFCAGHLDIANASRPINSKELKACAANRITFIELPIAFDALTVVVHPANTWARQISTGELARLWGRQAESKVNRWVNVNRDWPERPIKLCGPGKDSGTFDYFNKAINGSTDNSRSDYSASEDDNVIAQCVAGDPNALGYFGISYFKLNQNRLRALDILTPAGPFAPSIANVQSGRYKPLSRPLFIYVNDKALSSKADVQRFTTFTIRNGLRFVARVGYIPLPSGTYRLVETKLYNRVPGSSFSGDLPIGLGIGESLRRSLNLSRPPLLR